MAGARRSSIKQAQKDERFKCEIRSESYGKSGFPFSANAEGGKCEHSRRFLIPPLEWKSPLLIPPSWFTHISISTRHEWEKSQLMWRYQHMIKHNQRFPLISFISSRTRKSSEPQKHAIFICSVASEDARRKVWGGWMDWMETCFDVVMFVSIKEITSSTSRSRLATSLFPLFGIVFAWEFPF